MFVGRNSTIRNIKTQSACLFLSLSLSLYLIRARMYVYANTDTHTITSTLCVLCEDAKQVHRKRCVTRHNNKQSWLIIRQIIAAPCFHPQRVLSHFYYKHEFQVVKTWPPPPRLAQTSSEYIISLPLPADPNCVRNKVFI